MESFACINALLCKQNAGIRWKWEYTSEPLRLHSACVHTYPPPPLSFHSLSLSISLYISLCVSQRIGTRACSLRPGITACRINNPSFTCCLCPKPCPSFEKNDRDTCLGGKMDASRTIGSRQIKGNIVFRELMILIFVLYSVRDCVKNLWIYRFDTLLEIGLRFMHWIFWKVVDR